MGFFGQTALAGPLADQVMPFPLQLVLWIGSMAVLVASAVAILCSTPRARRLLRSLTPARRRLDLVVPIRAGR